MELPGERFLIRLWETIADKGIGSLLKPWQIRREGRAHIDVESEAIVALAQAEQDADDIRSGRKRLDGDGRLIALPGAMTSLPPETAQACGEESTATRAIAQIASGNLVSEAIRREVNVAKAVLAAETELGEATQELPARTVDDDWLFRWRDCAGTMSSEQLQQLWGQVLAGEIKSPGSFSLRTLDFFEECVSTRGAGDSEAIAILNW